jgi:hypothetical protein
MLARTILVSPITDTSAATSAHFEESWPSHPVFTPIPSVATAATMMTLIPIDAGTIDLRQNASAECGLTAMFCARRRWSGMTIATFVPEDVLCSTARRGASGRMKKPLPPRAIKSRQDAVRDRTRHVRDEVREDAVPEQRRRLER